MDLRNPPRLAVALLKSFGLVQNEALAGDLVEELHSGRTTGWFWRQTLTAIWAVVKSAKSLFVPVMIGWSVQLLIVETLVARRVHFGLYGSLLLVVAYVALFAALIHISVELELSRWWDILFSSFLNAMFGSGWIAFIDVLASLVPARYGLTSSSAREYLWINLIGLCFSARWVIKSHQDRDPEVDAV